MAKMLKIASIGTGLPIVFIHGWGLNSGVWQPCIELLKDKYQVITVDMPGFGINVDYQLSPYTLADIASTIHEAVGQPAVYIGWSLGGMVATEIACQFQESVKGLVTVASTPCFVEENTNEDQADWPGIKAEVLALFHRQLEQDTQKTINNFLKIQAMGSPHLRDDIKLIRNLVMQYPMPSKETLDDSLKFLEQEDQRSVLAKVSLPFLRMYGKLDGLVPKAVICQIDELAPKSEKVLFEKASHAPFISNLNEFNEALTKWLDNHFIDVE